MNTPKDREIAKLIVLVSIIIGGWVRFLPAQLAGFPINDGGMFYSMIEDLYTNNFILPRYTSYNLSDIPYAYPPFGFYLGALLKLFGIDTLNILMYLPPTLSTLIVLAFFLLARQIFNGSWSHAALATLTLALIPRSYTSFVMGGGLTRSLGNLFLILFLVYLLELYKNPRQALLWRSGILGGLALLSHPEASIHALTAGIVFWLFRSRTWRGILNSLLVALIALAFSSVWWGTVLWQHGPAPFLSALQTGQQSQIFSGLSTLISFRFTEETMAPLVAVLGILGLIYSITRKKYFLPTWLLVHFISQPRSAGAVAIYPLALLASIALAEIILPVIALNANRETTAQSKILVNKNVLITTASLTIYLVLASLIYSTGLGLYRLSLEERSAMNWIKAQTPDDAKFVILKMTDDPMLDHSAEWFPTLTKRQSLLTLQGQEWVQGAQFTKNWGTYKQAVQCLFQDIACLEHYLAQHQIQFDYIYIAKQPVGPAIDKSSEHIPLVSALKNSSEYQLVYENKGAVLFLKR